MSAKHFPEDMPSYEGPNKFPRAEKVIIGNINGAMCSLSDWTGQTKRATFNELQ